MYIPKHYQGKANEAVRFMKRFNFASIISLVKGRQSATQLPFAISSTPSGLKLYSHFARANPQWKELASQEALIIFTEPHAYISPSFYNKKQNVPTWNYLAVHAYGRAKLIEEDSAVLCLLERMMDTFEEGYKARWSQLPESYKMKMLKGIMSFEFSVDEIQFKEKLSQNKKGEEQQRIIDQFSSSDDLNEQVIAEFMSHKAKKESNES